MTPRQMELAVLQLLRNQVRIADMLAVAKVESAAGQQDRANLIGLETQRMFNALGEGDVT